MYSVPRDWRLSFRGCIRLECWQRAGLVRRFERCCEALALTPEEVQSAEKAAQKLSSAIKEALLEIQGASQPWSHFRELVLVGCMLTGSIPSGSAIFLSYDVDMLVLFHSSLTPCGNEGFRQLFTRLASDLGPCIKLLKDQHLGMTVAFEGYEVDLCIGLLNIDQCDGALIRTASLNRYRTWLALQLPRHVLQAVRFLKAWSYALKYDASVATVPFHGYCFQALAAAVFMQEGCTDVVSVLSEVWSALSFLRDDGDICLHVNVMDQTQIRWVKPEFQAAPRCVVVDPFTGVNVVMEQCGLTRFAAAARRALDMLERHDMQDVPIALLVDVGLPDHDMDVLKHRSLEVETWKQAHLLCASTMASVPCDRARFLNALEALIADGRMLSTKPPDHCREPASSSTSRSVGSAVPARLRVSRAELEIRYERIFERLSYEFGAQGETGKPERLLNFEYMRAMVEAYVARDFVLDAHRDIKTVLEGYARKLSHLYSKGELDVDFGPHVLPLFESSGDLETFYYDLGCEAVEALGY